MMEIFEMSLMIILINEQAWLLNFLSKKIPYFVSSSLMHLELIIFEAKNIYEVAHCLGGSV